MTDQSTHTYLPGPLAADWRGGRPCTCGLPRSNRVHDTPETPPEAAAIDARILGETEEQERSEEMAVTDPGCNAGYHRNEADGPVIWRDPEHVLGEPHPWHPNHRPHNTELPSAVDGTTEGNPS